MKKHLQNIGSRILLLAALLAGLNFVYERYIWDYDLAEHADIMFNLREVLSDSCEIVYFAESSNLASREDDLDKRVISDFLPDYFPGKKFGDVSKGAQHAEIYYALLKNIPQNSSVKTVIITLNMRSFDAGWIYSDLETSLQKTRTLIYYKPPLLARALLSFKAYDIKSKDQRKKQLDHAWTHDSLKLPWEFPYKNVMEWDKALNRKGMRKHDGQRDEKLTELACHYVKTYAFNLDTATNPRIRDFDRIVAYAKERGWNLVFNILAENVQKAEKLVGRDLVWLMRDNHRLVKERYTRMGVVIADNFDKVPDEEFIDQHWTTEHYAEQGRKIVAKNVAEALRRFYPEAYTEVSYKQVARTLFFQDCEHSEPWGQMQTLSREKASSGKFSSKISSANPYSITFEKPLRALPDTSLHWMFLEAMAFQESPEHNTKLILDITGPNYERYWKSWSLQDLSPVTGQWGKVKFQLDLPDDIAKAGLIKIFFENSSDIPVYIDDFRVEFR